MTTTSICSVMIWSYMRVLYYLKFRWKLKVQRIALLKNTALNNQSKMFASTLNRTPSSEITKLNISFSTTPTPSKNSNVVIYQKRPWISTGKQDTLCLLLSDCSILQI